MGEDLNQRGIAWQPWVKEKSNDLPKRFEDTLVRRPSMVSPLEIVKDGI